MVECRPRNISTSGSERRHVFHGIWAVQRHACTATPLHNGNRWSILDTVNVIIRRNARWSVWNYIFFISWPPPLPRVAPLFAILRFFRPRKATVVILRLSLPRTTADANIDARGVVDGCCSNEFLGAISVYYRKRKKVNQYVLSRLMDKKRMVSSLSLCFLTTSRVHKLPEPLLSFVRSY
jgi:hypothetical protein